MSEFVRKSKIHLHFHKRGDVENISFLEIFWSKEEDMRNLSFLERIEAYALSIGDTEIQYAHVEISFDFDDVSNAGQFQNICTQLSYDDLKDSDYRIAASASGESTFFMPRLYTSTLYTTYEIDWPTEYVHRMIKFAAEQQGKRFMHGIFQTFLVPTPPDSSTWFCAQYITAILQVGGLMDNINASEMTGDLIISYIQTFYHARLTSEPGRASAVARSISKFSTRQVPKLPLKPDSQDWFEEV